MEAPRSFKEAVARSSCQLRRTLFLTTPPLHVISQSYNSSGSIANHEGVPHPAGSLFILNREHEIHLSAGVGEEHTQEKAMDNGNHKVLTSYAGHACEKTISISTSHDLGSNNCIKIHYASNLRGDAFCSLYACHHFDEESLLSMSYLEGLSSEPAVEVELQQGKGNFKATGKFEKNLVSGLHQLHVHSKAVLPAKLTLKNSVNTDLQRNAYSGLEFAWASSHSNFTSCVLLGIDGRRELSLHGSQGFWKAIQAELSASTNFNAQHSVSVKVEQQVSKENKISMNVTSNAFSIQEVSVMATLAEQRSSWKWKYRKVSEDQHLLSLDWQCKRNSDDVYSFNIEARGPGLAVNGEFRHAL